jgi:hypothetical protein
MARMHDRGYSLVSISLTLAIASVAIAAVASTWATRRGALDGVAAVELVNRLAMHVESLGTVDVDVPSWAPAGAGGYERWLYQGTNIAARVPCGARGQHLCLPLPPGALRSAASPTMVDRGTGLVVVPAGVEAADVLAGSGGGGFSIRLMGVSSAVCERVADTFARNAMWRRVHVTNAVGLGADVKSGGTPLPHDMITSFCAAGPVRQILLSTL